MNNPKVITAKTFTCNYISKEDRLLLTINYEEIENRVDFWITRSFLLKLLPHFFDYVSEDYSNEKNDNTKNTDNTTFNLTFKTPILLESVGFKNYDNAIEIVFKSLEHNIFAKATLDKSIFQKVVKLLINSSPTYEWGIINYIN
ncbi:hypothetical protein ACKGJI_08775 [Sulfurospirillum sp. 1307]